MAEPDHKNSEGKGFAGFASLVTNIDEIPLPDVDQTAATSSDQSNVGNEVATQSAESSSQSSRQQVPHDSNDSTQRKVGFLLFLGIAIYPYLFVWLLFRRGHSASSRLLGLIWLVAMLAAIIMETPSRPEPQSARSVANLAVPSNDSSYKTPIAEALSPRENVPQQPREAKPEVGKALLLTIPQITYCLSEDIRLQGARSSVNNHINADVTRFNTMVADFNNRCGSFRYRRGALESARRDIEPYRKQLQAEGRSRFARSPATSAPSSSVQSRSAPDETVEAIQRKLNDLGYDAGVVDGLPGRRTRLAISTFQRDYGIHSDGVASGSLLAQINAITRSSRPSSDSKNIPNDAARENTIDKPTANYVNEASRDKENYRKCIDGRHPALCNHSLLTQAEAARVAAAEHKANFEKCIDGRYPALCNHSLLTQTEAARVGAAEHKANFEKCIDGRYPALCNHSLLTQAEAARVSAAEHKANFEKCIDGRYPALCNHSLLTQAEAARVSAAEHKANFEKCIDGRYPALCNHALLTQVEAQRVAEAERLSRNR